MSKWFLKFTLIIALIPLAAGFSGCGGKHASDHLLIWGMGLEGDRLKDIVKFYQEENPDAKIEIQSIPWGMAHEKMITAFAGERTPDLCQFGTTWIPEFVTLEALEPLDTYIANSELIGEENYYPGSWQTAQIDDAIYGIPWYVDTRVLFYRKDLLSEIGYDHAPRTWDELLKISRELTVKDAEGNYSRYGLALPAVDWMVLCMFLWSNGGNILSPEGEVIINSPENLESLEFYANFFTQGMASRSIQGGVSLYNNFKTGLVPMFIGGSWMLEDIHSHVPEIDGQWMVAVLPKKKTSTSFVGGSNWCIFEDSQKKEEAWKFIEFMSRPDIQIKWYQLTTDLPTRKEAWENEFFDDKPMVKVFGEQLQDTQSPPKIQKWEEMATKINQQMEQAVFGEVTAEEALVVMEKDITDVLEHSAR